MYQGACVQRLDRALWGLLPFEVIGRVLSCLPPNELACTIRLVSKAFAELFRDKLIVRLSQLSPEPAFASKWADGQALRDLPLSWRQSFLCLTARSGSVENLRVALGAAGCPVYKGVLNCAADAGHLHVCQWLMVDRSCPVSHEAATSAARAGHLDVLRWALRQLPLAAADAAADAPFALPLSQVADRAWYEAARAGRQNVCEGLLADGFAPTSTAVFAAARAGHVGLIDWLLLRQPLPQLRQAHADLVGFHRDLLASAADGFNLEALQLLYASPQLQLQLQAGVAECARDAHIVGEAVGSTTPDWREKTEWLLTQGLPLRAVNVNWYGVAMAPDAVERLQFVWARDAKIDPMMFTSGLVDAGNASLIEFLRAEGFCGWDWQEGLMASPVESECSVAHLAAIKAAGCPVTWDVFDSAVTWERLDVLQWLWDLEREHGGLRISNVMGKMLMDRAAGVGSVELVEWLAARGCRWDERTFNQAAAVGSPPLLEFLAARGCPMGDVGMPYILAGRNCDFVTLECLRRLGCPWDELGFTFELAVSGERLYDSGGACSLQVLRWLHHRGCPLNWSTASLAAFRRPDDDEAERVRAWIEGYLGPPDADSDPYHNIDTDPDPDPDPDTDPDPGPDTSARWAELAGR